MGGVSKLCMITRRVAAQVFNSNLLVGDLVAGQDDLAKPSLRLASDKYLAEGTDLVVGYEEIVIIERFV